MREIEPITVKVWPVQIGVLIEALENLHDDCEQEIDDPGSVWEDGGEDDPAVEWKRDQCNALLTQLEMINSPEAN